MHGLSMDFYEERFSFNMWRWHRNNFVKLNTSNSTRHKYKKWLKDHDDGWRGAVINGI